MDLQRSVQADNESVLKYSSERSSSNHLDVTAVATLFVTLIALWVALGWLKRKRLPPGPFAWPVVGSFPALGGDLPHHVLRSLAAKYGGLMYLRLGSVPTIVVSTVAMSKEIFQTHDAVFLDRPKTMAFDILTDNYKNLVPSSGLYWRQLRKLCSSELFTPRRLASYKTARAEAIHHMSKQLVEDAKQGRAVNLKSWLMGITSNNMTRMLTNKRYFGDDGSYSKKDKEDFELMIESTFDLVGAFIISDYVPYLGFISKLQGWKKKLEVLRDLMHDVAGKMCELDKHRQRAQDRKGDEGYVPDFVDLLLRTPLDDGKVLPEKNLKLLLVDMITAGAETSATAVEWAMAELMNRPDLMQRLQDELNTVIGKDRLPQEADIPNLPFLNAIVKENFRLHPPVTINLPRESTQEFEFQGFKFPKRTRLMLNIFTIHRDPAVYEDPDAFKPERFLDQHKQLNHLAGFDSYELTPFSAGRRMCPAAELGNTMVVLMLAHLVHSFQWSLPAGVETVDRSEHFGLTTSLKTPLRLIPKANAAASLY